MDHLQLSTTPPRSFPYNPNTVLDWDMTDFRVKRKSLWWNVVEQSHSCNGWPSVCFVWGLLGPQLDFMSSPCWTRSAAAGFFGRVFAFRCSRFRSVFAGGLVSTWTRQELAAEVAGWLMDVLTAPGISSVANNFHARQEIFGNRPWFRLFFISHQKAKGSREPDRNDASFV